MVVTLADEVAEAADPVEVVIDCAAAWMANTTGLMVANRMVFREIVKVRKRVHGDAGLRVHFISAWDDVPDHRRGRHVDGKRKVVYGDIEDW
jgi:hypothetical protein